jgi:hypothetical protein
MNFDKDIDNECAFNILSSNGICTDLSVISKLKNTVANFNNKLETNPQKILEILKKKYNCDSESCVITHDETRRILSEEEIAEQLKNRFKPKGPRNTLDWLSNVDIDDVLKQIQEKYKDKHFYHIDFQMRDFKKSGSELATFNFSKQYKLGYRTFGTVINTDYSTGGGIHWFAIFGDFLENNNCYTIEYFNSSGESPLDEILVWMKDSVLEWSSSFDKPIKDIIVSKIQHQKEDNACGVYSLYYIISRLDGHKYTDFRKERIPDKVMDQFRKYLFRDEL